MRNVDSVVPVPADEFVHGTEIFFAGYAVPAGIRAEYFDVHDTVV